MNRKQSFVIEGLAGKKKLGGKVVISGAKNAALKAMAASILFDSTVTLSNVPDTDDIKTLAEIMRKLGAKVSWNIGAKVMEIDAGKVASTEIDAELAKSMRASVTLTGPLLGRFGKTSFPAPGGCVIGARPIDLFLEGYKRMGAAVEEYNCLYRIKADKGVVGTEIFFTKQTVGGTETLMMAAVLGKGKTVLKNCAMEPEISSIADWLNECGANINGAGTATIEIEGTDGKLLQPKAPYVTIPDRIEAGSFLILGALCADELTIENCEPGHLDVMVNILRESGVPIEIPVANTKPGPGAGIIRITGNSKPNSSFKAVNDLRTHEYPGFPTDLQPPMVTFLTQTTGGGAVFETIYEGRFKYVEDLQRMGADITIMNPHEIMVKGPSVLRQLPDEEELCAHDIRAGFAVVLAALLGEGKFMVNNIQLIDRGYERLEKKLKAIGADIERVS